MTRRSGRELDKFETLLSYLAFGHETGDVWADRSNDTEVDIRFRGTNRSFNAELLSAIIELLEVRLKDIEIEGWQEIAKGCDTCGDGQKFEATIWVRNMPIGISMRALSPRASALLEKAKRERAEEQAEDEKKAEEAALKAASERENKKNQNKLLEAQRVVALSTFRVLRDKIFAYVFEWSNTLRAQNVSRKTIGLYGKAEDITEEIRIVYGIILKFWSLKGYNKETCRQVFDKQTEKAKTQIALVRLWEKQSHD